MNLNSLAFMFIVKTRVEHIGGPWVVSNSEVMDWLDISRDKFDSMRDFAVRNELVTYECRSIGGVKKGVYDLGSKCRETQHMLGNQSPLIYIYNINNNIPIHKEGVGKPSICRKTQHIPKTDTDLEEFNTIWPSLRINDRSSKAQSLKAWRICRKKYTAEQIQSSWQNKIKSYSNPKEWACGFQVFCKPENIADMISKQPKPQTLNDFAKECNNANL